MSTEQKKLIALIVMIVSALFFVVGVVLTITDSVATAKEESFMMNAGLAQAEIVDKKRVITMGFGNNTKYEVYVNYKYGGKSYKDVNAGQVSPNYPMDVGDGIYIWVDNRNPENVMIPSLPKEKDGLYILIFGVVIFVISFYQHQNYKKQYLEEMGLS